MIRQLVKENENSELKPVKLRLKIDLVSHPAHTEGLGKYVHKLIGSYNQFSFYDLNSKDIIGGCSRGAVVNVLNCDIVVSEFELQSSYSVHFRINAFGIK